MQNEKGIVPLIVVLVAVVLLSGGYVASVKLEGTNPKVDDKIITETVDQFIPRDESVSWKTYTNTNYGFEFKYPEHYAITTTPPLRAQHGILLEITENINNVSMADGACGEYSAETLRNQRNIVENNLVGAIIDNKIEILNILKTATQYRALLSLFTCQGIANDNDPAHTFATAYIYKGDTLVTLILNFPFNINEQIKVKDIEVVANQLIRSQYTGPEQEYVDEFIQIISTFEFTK